MMIALRLNNQIFWIAVANFLVNASLDVLLAHFLGSAGIAIACSAVYAFSFVCLWILVERRFQYEIQRKKVLHPQ
jgi:peptidoglycan biosynthesis protein MviN/MurJ (putative lipid II flippase)